MAKGDARSAANNTIPQQKTGLPNQMNAPGPIMNYNNPGMFGGGGNYGPNITGKYQQPQVDFTSILRNLYGMQ